MMYRRRAGFLVGMLVLWGCLFVDDFQQGKNYDAIRVYAPPPFPPLVGFVFATCLVVAGSMCFCVRVRAYFSDAPLTGDSRC